MVAGKPETLIKEIDLRLCFEPAFTLDPIDFTSKTEPQSPSRPAANTEKKSESVHNLQSLGAAVTWTGRDDDGTIYEENLSSQGLQTAVVDLSNQPLDSQFIPSIRSVHAVITFFNPDGIRYHTVNRGIWLKEEYGEADFNIAKVNRLVVAVKVDREDMRGIFGVEYHCNASLGVREDDFKELTGESYLVEVVLLADNVRNYIPPKFRYLLTTRPDLTIKPLTD